MVFFCFVLFTLIYKLNEKKQEFINAHKRFISLRVWAQICCNSVSEHFAKITRIQRWHTGRLPSAQYSVGSVKMFTSATEDEQLHKLFTMMNYRFVMVKTTSLLLTYCMGYLGDWFQAVIEVKKPDVQWRSWAECGPAEGPPVQKSCCLLSTDLDTHPSTCHILKL